jgi:hypothetical protein
VAARLDRRPGLGGRQEKRALDVDALLEPPDRRRVRGVENVEALGAERPAHDLRGEARAAHPEQHELLGVDARGGLHELVDPLAHA